MNNAVLGFMELKERKLALTVDNVTSTCVILNVMMSIIVFFLYEDNLRNLRNQSFNVLSHDLMQCNYVINNCSCNCSNCSY